ncbi:MAG TPA: C39 family peptidase [Candidatus Saccharimonadales bacterium]|nr:C39 family peptidase [Candidatus Saccharimonadales bacterium]
MKSVKKIVWKCIFLYKTLQYITYSPQKAQRKVAIPYYSQFTSRKLVSDFLTKTKAVQEDPHWRESGAKTKEEYEIWAWNGCGMVCLQMILSQKFHKKIPFVTLGRTCEAYGGYSINKKAKEKHDYKNYYDGLFYNPFLTFIQKEYNLKAKILSPMIHKEIIKALDTNNFVVASVHPAIRNPASIPNDNRGHLILIVGYDMNKNNFYLHNPSGLYNTSQEFAEISFKDFTKFFAGRGIVIQN